MSGGYSEGDGGSSPVGENKAYWPCALWASWNCPGEVTCLWWFVAYVSKSMSDERQALPYKAS